MMGSTSFLDTMTIVEPGVHQFAPRSPVRLHYLLDRPDNRNHQVNFLGSQGPYPQTHQGPGSRTPNAGKSPHGDDDRIRTNEPPAIRPVSTTIADQSESNSVREPSKNLCRVTSKSGKEQKKNVSFRKCPSCSVFFQGSDEYHKYQGNNRDGYWWLLADWCPNCDKLGVWVGVEEIGSEPKHTTEDPPDGVSLMLIYPKSTGRPPVPPEVPEQFTKDYLEACLTLNDSPKASAALSRRCLQDILREVAKVKKANLYQEIQEVIERKDLPDHIVQIIDVPRSLGNIAAHPIKSAEVGEIIDVEPWEAEWCLEVFEALYEHYFAMPARNTERLERLKKKIN